MPLTVHNLELNLTLGSSNFGPSSPILARASTLSGSAFGSASPAGDDPLERQAVTNERAIRRAAAAGSEPLGLACMGQAGSGRSSRDPMGSLRPAFKLQGEGPSVAAPIAEDGIVKDALALFQEALPYLGVGAEVGVSLIPVVGDIYDLLCGLTGKAIITWQSLDVYDRILCFVGVLPIPFVAGPVLRHGKRALRGLISRSRAVEILSGLIKTGTDFVRRNYGRLRDWVADLVGPAAVSARAWGAKVVARVNPSKAARALRNRKRFLSEPEFAHAVAQRYYKTGKLPEGFVSQRVYRIDNRANVPDGFRPNPDLSYQTGQDFVHFSATKRWDEQKYFPYIKRFEFDPSVHKPGQRAVVGESYMYELDIVGIRARDMDELSLEGFHSTNYPKFEDVVLTPYAPAEQIVSSRRVRFTGEVVDVQKIADDSPYWDYSGYRDFPGGKDGWGDSKSPISFHDLRMEDAADMPTPTRGGWSHGAYVGAMRKKERVGAHARGAAAQAALIQRKPLQWLRNLFSRADPAELPTRELEVGERHGDDEFTVPPPYQVGTVFEMDLVDLRSRQGFVEGYLLGDRFQVHGRYDEGENSQYSGASIPQVYWVDWVEGEEPFWALLDGNHRTIDAYARGLKRVKVKVGCNPPSKARHSPWAKKEYLPIQRTQLWDGEDYVGLVEEHFGLLRKAAGTGAAAEALGARLYAKGAPSASAAPDGFELLLRQSSGQPLPQRLQAKMRDWLGAEFRSVRVHTDAKAQQAAAAVNAEAFTLGNDVYFGRGFYDPSSPKGVALIGHELTHVAQNMSGAKTLSAKALRRKEEQGFGSFFWERVKDGTVRDDLFNTLLAIPTTAGAVGTFFYGALATDEGPFHVMASGTPSQVASALKLLERRSSVDPEAIYDAARAVTGSNRAALRLSLNIAINHAYSLPLTQLPGIDSKDINDKYAHFFSCAVLASFRSSQGATLTGFLKEVMDEVTGSGYSSEDMVANRQGAQFGYLRRSERGAKGLHRKPYAVAPHDRFEQQADANERAIYKAMVGDGWQGASSGPALLAVSAASRAQAKTIRRSGLIGNAVDYWGKKLGFKDPATGQTTFMNGVVNVFKGLAFAADIAIGFVPIAGQVYDLACGVVGRAIFTWERLPTWARLLSMAASVIPSLGGATLRKGGVAAWRGLKGGVCKALGVTADLADETILRKLIDKSMAFIRKHWVDVKTKLKKLSHAFGELKASAVQGARDIGTAIFDRAASFWQRGKRATQKLGASVGDRATAFWERGQKRINTFLKRNPAGKAAKIAALRADFEILLKMKIHEVAAATGRNADELLDEALRASKSEMDAMLDGVLDGYRFNLDSAVKAVKSDGHDVLEWTTAKYNKTLTGGATTKQGLVDYGELPWIAGGGAALADDAAIYSLSRGGAVGAGLNAVSVVGHGNTVAVHEFGHVLQYAYFQKLFKQLGVSLDAKELKLVQSYLEHGQKSTMESMAYMFGTPLIPNRWRRKAVNSFVDTVDTNLRHGNFKNWGNKLPGLEYLRSSGVWSVLGSVTCGALGGLAGGPGAALFMAGIGAKLGGAGGVAKAWGVMHKGRKDAFGSFADTLDRRGRMSANVDAALEDVSEPGLPLEASVRSRLEKVLGEDLSEMRVHTGLRAEKMALAIEAEAFTIGQHVFMGPGVDLESTQGMGTLAHEATHVVQASQGRVGPAYSTNALEAEAYARERTFVAQALPTAARGVDAPTPVFRDAAPALDDIPATAPLEAPLKKRVLRKEAGSGGNKADAVQKVMDTWQVQGLSREEFVGDLKERLLSLLHDELELDNERRETLAWNYNLPMM